MSQLIELIPLIITAVAYPADKCIFQYVIPCNCKLHTFMILHFAEVLKRLTTVSVGFKYFDSSSTDYITEQHLPNGIRHGMQVKRAKLNSNSNPWNWDLAETIPYDLGTCHGVCVLHKRFPDNSSDIYLDEYVHGAHSPCQAKQIQRHGKLISVTYRKRGLDNDVLFMIALTRAGTIRTALLSDINGCVSFATSDAVMSMMHIMDIPVAYLQPLLGAIAY